MHSYGKPALAALIALATGAATLPPAKAFDASNKKELGMFIHDYIVEHPEVLLEAQDALQKKQEAKRRDHMKSVITANRKAIFDAPGDLVIGNPKGDVTLVEFYDYNCPYCKHAVSDMHALVEADNKLRFVLKEFPILGQDSVAASRVSMAVQIVAPDKYKAFHDKLMGSQQRATGDSAFQVAEDLGIAKSALKDELESPEIEKRIKQTYALADALNINGTPAYVIGDDAISGAVGSSALEDKVQNMRKCDSTSC